MAFLCGVGGSRGGPYVNLTLALALAPSPHPHPHPDPNSNPKAATLMNMLPALWSSSRRLVVSMRRLVVSVGHGPGCRESELKLTLTESVLTAFSRAAMQSEETRLASTW